MDLKDEKIPAANIEPEKEAGETIKKRKPQQAKPAHKQSKKVDAAGFAKQLVGVHAIIASITQNPIWQINDSEASQLATAIEGIAAQYDIEVNPKVAATLNFVFVAATIYGPRIYLMREMAKQTKAAQPSQNVSRETMAEPKPEAHPLFNNVDTQPQPVQSSAFDIAGDLDNEWPE